MAVYRIATGDGVDSLETDIIRTTTLDTVAYDLRFRYNTREEAWYMSCGKSGGDTIFYTKLMVGKIANEPYKHRDDCPQGDMVVIDISNFFGRVDFDNFTLDGRFRLYYIEP